MKKIYLTSAIFLVIVTIILTITCSSDQRVFTNNNLTCSNSFKEKVLEMSKSNRANNSDLDISVSIDGRVIRSEKLNSCLIKKKQDTLKILFTNAGIAGNNILINYYRGSYESFIEFWSDYDEFDGKSNLILPIDGDSLILNSESFNINDSLYGVYNCQSYLNTEFFEGQVKVECDGSFSALVKERWE